MTRFGQDANSRDVVHYSDGTGITGPGQGLALLEPYVVGEMVKHAIETNRFFLPPDEAVRPAMVAHASDPDRVLKQECRRRTRVLADQP